MSDNLIKIGKEKSPSITNHIYEGNALNLNYKDSTFDVASLIGVLHHILNKDDQLKAINEALRVVKVNGAVIIRESNLINPLFWMYWNYVFPMICKIDRFGGENWISARDLVKSSYTFFENIKHFTFIPSFTPQMIMPITDKIEFIIENSPIKRLAAHYVIVLRKAE